MTRTQRLLVTFDGRLGDQKGSRLKQVPGYFPLFPQNINHSIKKGNYTPKSPCKRGKYTFPWYMVYQSGRDKLPESILPGRLWLPCRSSAWLDPCIYKSTSWRPGDPEQRQRGRDDDNQRPGAGARRDMVFQWKFPPFAKEKDRMISNLSKTNISQKLQLKLPEK